MSDCDKPPCKTDGCCCKKKKEQIEKCCLKDESCPKTAEVDGLKNEYNKSGSSIRTKGKSYESPFSDRKFLQAYLDNLYGDANKERAECARKRKCLLVPFNDANSVCCDDMTGHHIVPGESLRDSVGSCYNHGQALTVCMTGFSNHKGTHGAMHMLLKEEVKALRTDRKTPCKVKYSKMLDASVKSLDKATEGTCDIKCLKKELKENLKEQCPDAFKDGEPDVDAKYGNAPASDENLKACMANLQTMLRGGR